MEWGFIFLVLFTGIVAGFLNVVAGGGSLLTMPMLIFLGLPSAVANGTNRIALMAQNIVAITTFRKRGYFDWKYGLLMAGPAVIGSIIGASIAITMSDEIFNKILSIVMVVVLATIIWNPKKPNRDSDSDKSKTKKEMILSMIAFLFIGFYGGFIQAGVGFLIIASLTAISGMSLVKINSLKVFVVSFYMLTSLLVFIVTNQVHWGYGLSLAIGTSIGAWIGSNFAVSKGDKWIRIILIVAVTGMAIKLWFEG